MKKLLVMSALLGVACYSFGQGALNFANTAGTLISAGGTATATRNAANPSTHYIMALFWNVPGTAAPVAYNDPLWQTAAAYGYNHTAGTGRFTANTNSASTAPVNLNGTIAGGTVSLIVRAWSANAGSTWAEALAFYNNANPAQDMFLGQSVFSPNFVLGGGALPTPALFGAALPNVSGFNMALIPAIPEPSSMALAGLGAAALLLFRRRK
jgi:hypothetical protein